MSGSLDLARVLRDISASASEQNTATRAQNLIYDVELFIEEIQNYPCIWNTSARSHHDQNMRKVAWEELSQKFGKNGK